MFEEPAAAAADTRVSAGLALASGDNSTPDRYRTPLTMNAGLNATGSVSFPGTSVSGDIGFL